MKRIALFVFAGWQGGLQYTDSLVSAIRLFSREDRCQYYLTLAGFSPLPSEYSEKWPKEFDKTVFPSPTIRIDAKLRRVLDLPGSWETRLEKFFQEMAFDAVYANGLLPEELQRQFKTNIAWICDFQHKHLPGFFSSDECQGRDNLFLHIAQHSPLIVVSSESAKKDFETYYPDNVNKVRVLSFTSFFDLKTLENVSFEPVLNQYTIPEKFFIVSNQFWQHKNHLVVFEAMKILQQRQVFPHVVFTGGLDDYRNRDYIDIIRTTIAQYNLGAQVSLLGSIDRLHQLQLLRKSIAVIQPSLFEGWSTIVEESKALGKVILLSSIPVHLEQNPLNGYYFDPASPNELANQMDRAWQKFSPAFEKESEVQALQNYKVNQQAFSQALLSLFQEACTIE